MVGLARRRHARARGRGRVLVARPGVRRTRRRRANARGLVCALRAEPYEARVVLPHERTHAGPKEGRLRLLPRPARTWSRSSSSTTDGSRGPDGERVLEVELEGVRSRLWRLSGEPPEALADARLLIADGHHRYETTLAYHAEEGTDESAWLLVVIVPTEQEGLTIFPTHRIAERLEPVDGERPFEGELPGDRSAAVIYRAGGTTVVTGEPGEPDTALVDRLGLEGVTYTPHEEEAKAAVDSGAAEAAVLVRPPSVDLVRELAERGETMPQKSTYFFPSCRPGCSSCRCNDWLELCRAAAAEVEGVLAELPTRDERERVVGAGEGGDDTTAIDDAAERAS